MTSKKLNMLLINQFPELKDEYINEVSWQDGDDTGSHVVYCDVLIPYIKRMINEKNSIKLKKAFDFIEYILNLNYEYANEVIAFSVLESLLFDEDVDNSAFLKFAKDKTLKMVNEIVENI